MKDVQVTFGVEWCKEVVGNIPLLDLRLDNIQEIVFAPSDDDQRTYDMMRYWYMDNMTGRVRSE